MIILFTQPFFTIFDRNGDGERTPKKAVQIDQDTTPSKNVLSAASTFAVSFASDVSGLDEDEPSELLSKEFYSLVMKERKKNCRAIMKVKYLDGNI